MLNCIFFFRLFSGLCLDMKAIQMHWKLCQLEMVDLSNLPKNWIAVKFSMDSLASATIKPIWSSICSLIGRYDISFRAFFFSKWWFDSPKGIHHSSEKSDKKKFVIVTFTPFSIGWRSTNTSQRHLCQSYSWHFKGTNWSSFNTQRSHRRWHRNRSYSREIE